MDVSDMILAGTVHMSLIRLCVSLQVPAVGLSCADHSLVLGASIHDTYTGTALTCGYHYY